MRACFPMVCVFMLLSGLTASAAQPIRLNYQARLTDMSGAPLSGSHTLYFSLWGGPTASAGVANSGANLFAETAVASFTNGIVTWPIGTGTITSGSLAVALFDTSNDIYLQTAVDTGGNVVLPRTRLESVPFAVRAIASDTATNATNLNGLPASDYTPFGWSATTTNTQAAVNRGYMADSTELLTVTLPLAASIGDRVSVVGTGTGGWAIGQNEGQSIRTIGIAPGFPYNWTPHEKSRGWQSVASSADGTHLVACVYGGMIYTSTDAGTTWTARDSTRDWISVASSSDGTRLVACVDGGQIYTSPDSGVTWTPRDSSRFWSSVASSADGMHLLASVNNGQLYTSPDAGVIWYPAETTRAWYCVASSADGSHLAAGVLNGQIYTSPNYGVNWTPRDTNRLWYSVASSADGTRLAACAYGGQIYTSSDTGVTWTPRDSTRQWYSVASSADGTRLVAGVYNDRIFTSTDAGVTWTPRESIRNWYSVATSSDGIRLVGVVNPGFIYTSVAQTTVGTAGSVLGGNGSAIDLQFVGNNLWVPTNHEGFLLAH